MRRWEGSAHDLEHERIARVLGEHSRALERVRLTPVERQAVQSAAAKMVADEAIAGARARRAPLWRDRRAMISLGLQAVVALAVVVTLLHSWR